MIAAALRRMPVENIATLFACDVPDVFAFPALIRGAFDLIRSGCGAPHEIFRKSHLILLYEITTELIVTVPL